MDAPRDKAEDAITRSSGSVFADLGIHLTPDEMLKIEIARLIGNTIHERRLTQVQAAKRMKTDQAKVSAIVRGRLEQFSIDRLVNFFSMLGHDIEVRYSKGYREHEAGKIKVRAA